MNTNHYRRHFVVIAVVLGIACAWFAQTAVTSAQVSSSTASVPDIRDVFDTFLRIRGSTVTVTDAASSSAVLPTPAASSILDMVPDIDDVIAGASSTATTSPSDGLGSTIVDMVNGTVGGGSGSVTNGFGSAIADAITGGASGFGTSDFGPFIKCVLLAPVGPPIPGFSTECNATTTTNKARLTIVKNSSGGNAVFDFIISGQGNASTSITTLGGTGSVQYLTSPGTFVISELMQDGWTQTSRGCLLSATTTGSAAGSLGWSVTLAAGADVVCTFENSATTTPGGGGETPGGGGGTPGGGGGTPGGGSSSGGGGGGGGGSSGGGGNGPILGGGGFSPGEVLGAATSVPEIPGIPNTGSGGGAIKTLLTLLASLSAMIAGAYQLRRTA